ncbi:MAG: TetR/AcrR family transcriptional regulator [Pseudomonadota bacterium]
MAGKPISDERRYHHGGLKQVLLEETARILREEGESALSLRRLASNLGVSRTAPYNHFKNKDALLAGVAEEGFRKFERAMRTVRQRHKDSPGNQFLRALVNAYVNFALKNQEYYDLMYSSKSWGTAKPQESLVATAKQTLLDDIARMKRAQDEGRIAGHVDVTEFSRIYWGTLHGISRLTLDGIYSNASIRRKLCNSTADMLWHQLDPARER